MSKIITIYSSANLLKPFHTHRHHHHNLLLYQHLVQPFPTHHTLTTSLLPLLLLLLLLSSTLGIISISQYRDIDRQPHMAMISWDRLRLRYRADATQLILMNGMKVNGLDACPRSNRLHGKGEGVAEWTTTQHVKWDIGSVSAWLTGSFTLLLNQPWWYLAWCMCVCVCVWMGIIKSASVGSAGWASLPAAE